MINTSEVMNIIGKVEGKTVSWLMIWLILLEFVTLLMPAEAGVAEFMQAVRTQFFLVPLWTISKNQLLRNWLFWYYLSARRAFWLIRLSKFQCPSPRDAIVRIHENAHFLHFSVLRKRFKFSLRNKTYPSRIELLELFCSHKICKAFLSYTGWKGGFLWVKNLSTGVIFVSICNE